ncbi:hypothetical protein GGE67_004146 [Rhizobium leucaenae]|nr:hypothetical protein [Rhizobium leucaenae]
MITSASSVRVAMLIRRAIHPLNRTANHDHPIGSINSIGNILLEAMRNSSFRLTRATTKVFSADT